MEGRKFEGAPMGTERRSGSSRLTAYDTQTIKEQYAEAHGSESNSKLAVWSALSLYLNFINIFQLLLGLTGEREG